MNNKPTRFFFHYNKPLSKKKGKPQITVHWKKKCLIVDNVKLNVPVSGKINKRQPFFVLQGKATLIRIDKKLTSPVLALWGLLK